MSEFPWRCGQDCAYVYDPERCQCAIDAERDAAAADRLKREAYKAKLRSISFGTVPGGAKDTAIRSQR